jgi:DNA-binding NarL/FixJ family response regulator
MAAILRQEATSSTAFVDRDKMRGVLTLRRHGRPLESPRILIVDDHAELRSALRRRLTAEHWEVCGEVGDGPEAIAAARRLVPHLIVMDVCMPGMRGLEAARKILEQFPAMLIMLMTTPDADVVRAARGAGIRGTVSKLAMDEMVAGLHALVRGEEFHQLSER